ncbi:hypothetical protein Cgig2_001207 [Carnegiea gigantea]|uniref:DYW domain-containing protein n=1 Tax=Carnegiea gigantea TaxID=171969 RepID=A0A9Q1JZJ9_9CARY|nr:hypothetical protein Cgig2_001207 [Carnegiea gigantea]
MYCKCDGLADARLVFSHMKERNVITWSTMIARLAQNGFIREALELFEKMKLSGPRPNSFTIVGALFAWSHGDLLRGQMVLFLKLFGIDPGREHYGCMIDPLGRAVTWRTLLGACRVHKNADIASYATKQILKLVSDDVATYISLSNIYKTSERWGDGLGFEDMSHRPIDEITRELHQLIMKLRGVGYVPGTDFVLKDVEAEQTEKLAIVIGLMSLHKESIIRIRKKLHICGDYHRFAKLVAETGKTVTVIRTHVGCHHFQDGTCSCGHYW